MDTKRGGQMLKRTEVTSATLVKRINRKGLKDGEMLRLARGKSRRWLGDYYAVDVDTNMVIAWDVDPEEWGRALGVLKPWEKIRSS
jgi:hypothetical protein